MGLGMKNFKLGSFLMNLGEEINILIRERRKQEKFNLNRQKLLKAVHQLP